MKTFDFLTHGIRPVILIIVMMGALSLPGVFSMPVMDRDEARFTQASSQMLETGDYVVIRYHDGLRNKKPVGIHWLQSASVSLFSNVDDREIWAYRIPSFIGAVIAALSTFWIGSALFNRSSGLAAGVFIGSCLLLTSEAHIAKTDAAMVGFICVFMACLAQMRVRYNESLASKKTVSHTIGTKTFSLIFWFAMAWGVLIKGPVAPMVGGLAIAMLALWERRFAWLKPLTFWPGPVMFIWMVVPWFIAVQLATNGEFLHEAVGVDLGPKMVSGAEGHSAPPGTHLLTLSALIWPSILFIVPGLAITLANAFKKVETKGKKLPPLDSWKFLLAWLIPTWIVFEAMPTKLAHYTMPVYPALALMAGVAFDRFMSLKDKEPPAWSRWISFTLFSVVSLLLLAIISPWGLSELRTEAASDFGSEAARVLAIWKQDWQAVGAPVWPFILGLFVVIGTLYLFVKKQYDATLLAMIACSLVIGTSLRSIILPNQTWIIATDAAMAALKDVCGYPEESAARKNSPECKSTPAPKIVRAVTYAEPSFVFSVNGKITLPPQSNSTLPPLAEELRPVWLINTMKPAGKQALKEVIAQAATEERCVRLSRRFVKNYSNDDASELVAVAVEPQRCTTSDKPNAQEIASRETSKPS